MAKVATLHVKVEPSLAKGLKSIARQRQETMGDLVRQALAICYQPNLAGLNARQRQALEAYQGMFISIGKFARVMGCSVLDARLWLNEHGLGQKAGCCPEDVANA